MNNKNQQYRQGDVLIESIPSLPKKLVKVARESGRLILAHGSATGHSHGIATPRCDLYTSAKEPGVMFLDIRAAKAELTHDEHGTIVLPKGVYRVSRQSEYSPEAIRQVQD
jgi:hypothetical protein